MTAARIVSAACLALCGTLGPATAADPPKTWTFVSMPDFLNVDLVYPQKGWEEALDYVLKAVKAENPDFVLVAGDLVMGRWAYGEKGVRHWADVYYPAWIKRMRDHGLTYYACLGDHELGDDPWPPGQKKTRLVPEFKRAFVEHLKMPLNGPEHMKGTAWSLVHKGVLVVGVDVFEPDKKLGIAAKVTGRQLAWVDKTLADRKGAAHVVVMAHTPILGPVRRWSSSGLMLEGGRGSPLWKTMSKRGVDLYLCGEVHDMTCTERDGVQEIAHGGLFGYNSRVNYLLATVAPDRITLELKEIDIVCEGPKLWQVGTNRPRERVSITEAVRGRGFVSVGRMVIDKTGPVRVMRGKTGRFDEAGSPRGVTVVPAPADLSAAVLHVRAGAGLTGVVRRKTWQKDADAVVVRKDGFGYAVRGGVFRGKGTSAWGGSGPVELTVTCPKGFTGRLLVNFSTAAKRGNRRMPPAGCAIDAQPLFFMGPAGRAVWAAFDVTAGRSADGRVLLKMNPGGTAVRQIALLPGR